MKKYTLTTEGCQAHTIKGSLVIVPDEVYADQEAYDGSTFPVLEMDTISRKYTVRGRARLMGDLYDLHGAGTGDMVVRIV